MQTAPLVIRLFGAPSISSGSDRAQLHLAPKALSVLAYLLLHRGVPVSRDTIAFALWPDDREDLARANLRRMIYLLQRTLPRESVEWLSLERRTLRWNVEAPCWLDVAEYDRLRAADRFAEAVELYGGDLLAPLEDEWIASERERYREQHLRLLHALIVRHRDAGEYARAIEYAKSALRVDPWREDFVRSLIELRSESGDRAGALREYQTFAASLKRELGAEPMPETLTAMSQFTASPEGAVSRPLRRPGTETAHNLPSAISAFVGRVHELEELSKLAVAERLVTLVGPGGVGKTRLALALAERIIERYADGVRLIDLAPITEPEHLLQAVAAALDLDDLEGRNLAMYIADQLRGKQVLLVFDNCERVAEPCAEFVERVLRRCPRVAVLATSRERLSIGGEVVYDVPALATPQEREIEYSPETLMSYDAVQLLCRRVGAAFPRFSLTAENAAEIAAICRRLDGIPLAIELAASHARALSPAQMLNHLDDRFALLKAPGRASVPHQQTMRDTIDWSYDLLDARERRVLCSVSVFTGSFSLDAARAICSAGSTEEDVTRILSRLIDKSFVTAVTRPGENRYRLLETIREYLVEKLPTEADPNAVRISHLAYFTRLAEQLEPQLVGADQTQAMSALIEETDNLRAAFDWPEAPAEARALHLRLAGALRWYYWFRGFLAEGLMRSGEALASGEQTTDVYAKALSTHGLCALQQGDVAKASASFSMALAIHAKRAQRDREAVLTEIHVGMAALFGGDRASASRYCQRALQTARDRDDPWLLAYALGSNALCAALTGDRTTSIEQFRESVAISQAMGERFQGAFWLLNLAIQEFAESPGRARETFLQCAQWGVEQRNERVIAGAFEGLAWCLHCDGADEMAARFLGAAQALRERRSQALLEQWRAAHEQAHGGIERLLGKERMTHEFEAGVRIARESSVDRLHQILREGNGASAVIDPVV